MSKTIRIGTRDSALALWQANTVNNKLQALGYETELVPIKSTGDIQLDKPVYELGITGIFTKTLDMAMLNGKVDIAVHSMKDVPTLLPKGIIQSAVLKRGSTDDVLIYNDLEFLNSLSGQAIVATGSLRRKSQWLNRYPAHHIESGLRGNVNTRLKKLSESNWNGAIFAKAGLERINMLPDNHLVLDWMVPAPAQGAMVVVTLENDSFSSEAVHKLNHKESEICTHIERDFLKVLEGGCTAPIGALAKIENNNIAFKGILLSIDGQNKFEITKQIPINDYKTAGGEAAKTLLERGGADLMKSIRYKLE